MRKDYFIEGLIARLFMGLIYFWLADTGALNDMHQIIYQSLENLFIGINPYSVKEYELAWGSGSFFQPMNYGPVTLLMYLPAMLFPQWIRYMWVGAYIMINIYSYFISEILQKISVYDYSLQKNAKINLRNVDPRENRFLYYAGVFFWLIPYGTMNVTIFIWPQILLCLLAFHYRNKPIICGLMISMAAMAYQLCFLFVPVYVIYLFKQNWKNVLKFLIGWIPALGILLFFIFWQPAEILWAPGGVIDSLFLYTGRQGYIKCPGCDGAVDFLHGSIPKIAYILSDGQIQIGNQSRMVMFIILGSICVWYFFTKRFDSNPELFLNWYFVLAVVLFTLTTNYGGIHYLCFMAIPLFHIFQIKHPDYRKAIPIGKNLNNYEEFETYLMKYHKLPV